jgi:diguanylate cyclase (GGDEF)-like protein
LFSLRLEQAINHAVRSESFAALLYLDVDQFKRVNDTLGHEAGDELLCEVGRRLTDCVRREDTVARLGGDEFAILLFDVRHPSDAGTVAEKILERIRHPLTIAGHGLVVTASIGVTIAPADSNEPNVLTKNADLAMYRAKDRGRNNFQFYAEEMNTRAVARLKTENELRQGLDAGQFELYYQPKVRLSDNRILGIECLLRWHHPERGFLTPDKFIDIAEESGVIIELGAWVVTEACRATEQLSRETGLELEVAVNISPRQFRDPKLVATIRRSLREARLKPFQLELEITETMLMSDREAATTTAHKLHDLGVKLAIDDFGTGYSSLNYLKRFPINTVKVDRSFVMDIPSNTDDMAITAAVIAMAHRMNLEVVAEGVETPAQVSFLVEHRCEYGQGYYFSKPVTFEGVQQLIAANRSEAAPARPPKSTPPQSPTKARLRPRT